MATSGQWAARLMYFHSDARRKFWGDIFATDQGDINVVRPTKGVFIGWHRHQHQDDRIWLVQGILRLRVFEIAPADGMEWVLVDTDDRLPLWIGRNKWHGYEALTNDTIILQFNGPSKWDGSDEERRSVEEVPWT